MNLFGDDDVIYDDHDDMDDAFASDDSYAVGADDYLKDPKSMAYCVGHEAQERLFIDLYKKGSMPHALVFAGVEGIGKATMAFRLTRFLLKNGVGGDNDQDSLFGGGESLPQEIDSLDVDMSDPVVKRIVSGGHADLLHLERNYDSTKGKREANLKVEQIRKIEPFLRKTASEGGWRIVIVEDADTMNRSAQNAILKILEEPPSNVLIILIAHRPGMLIPTIRSRSRVISFDALSPENMADLLSKQGHRLGAHDLEIVTDMSCGSIGAAIKYVEEGGLDTFRKICDYLSEMPEFKWHEIHELANSLSSPAKDDEYRLFREIFQWMFRQAVFVKARGTQGGDLPGYLTKPPLGLVLAHYSLTQLIEISDNLKNHFDTAEFSNLDRRDAVRGAFLMLKH